MPKTKQRRFYLFLSLLLLGLVVSLLADYVLPFGPYDQDLTRALRPPDAIHWLGTDRYGRDLLSRTLSGAKTTVCTALAVALAASSFGSFLGLFCGYHQGKITTVLLRLTDVFLAFPPMVFAIAVAGILGGGTLHAAAAITLVAWPKYTRLVRNQVLPLRHEYYIEAARMNGFSSFKILLLQILPEIIGPVLVTAALEIGTIITEIAGLSFLGLGAAPPAAEWGSMMSGARNLLQTAPWTVFVPGAAIFTTVALFQLFADSLRDLADAKTTR